MIFPILLILMIIVAFILTMVANHKKCAELFKSKKSKPVAREASGRRNSRRRNDIKSRDTYQQHVYSVPELFENGTCKDFDEKSHPQCFYDGIFGVKIPKDDLPDGCECAPHVAKLRRTKILNDISSEIENASVSITTNMKDLEDLETSPIQPIGCYKTNGVNIPNGYEWPQGDIFKDGLRDLQTVRYNYKNSILKLRKGGGDVIAKDAGYKYMAVTVVEGKGCQYYTVFGKEIPSVGNIDGTFCKNSTTSAAYSLQAGMKPDTTCDQIDMTNKIPGHTTWNIYDLTL